MRDPFHVTGPALISFSGGRTSGYMLRRVLDAYGGSLPVDVRVAFCNTGKEFTETLDFVRDVGERWGVDVAWLEHDYDAPARFRRVGHATAARDGEPFLTMIHRERYVPNPMVRKCTGVLKIKVLHAFAQSLAWQDHLEVIGLRADEQRRVAKMRARQSAGDNILLPLADANVTRAEVMAFWGGQPFDLHLRSHESNCDLCFLKGTALRARIMEDHPGVADWWVNVEATTGHRFTKRRPFYAEIRDAVARQGRLCLPIVDGDSLDDCYCTD